MDWREARAALGYIAYVAIAGGMLITIIVAVSRARARTHKHVAKSGGLRCPGWYNSISNPDPLTCIIARSEFRNPLL